MVITSGRVVAGKIVVDGDPLPEGATVTVLSRDGDETFMLDTAAEAELLESMAEGDRGETIPAEDVLPALRIGSEPTYADGMQTLRALVARIRAVGGNTYPPNAPFFSRVEWMAHYGPERWRRLAAGKRRFDPMGVLTPGPRMFSM